MYEIVDHAKDGHEAEHSCTVVHGDRRDRCDSRPKAEERDDSQIHDAQNIDQDSRPAGNSPWAPGKLDAVLIWSLWELFA